MITHTPELRPAVGILPPGFRLSNSTRIGYVSLQVADLDRSREFYVGVLGLRELDRYSGRMGLGAQDGDQLLVELVERRGIRSASRRGRPGLYHFALLLPARAALGSFIRHVADRGVRIGASDHLVSEAVYLSDPDGLGIEVYADRPRDTWEVRDRQIVMATEPLDIDDLIRTSNGIPWTGAPEGTIVGHMHLHVSDLEAAAAFYHDALGFDKVVWGYPGALFLSAGGYHHHLGLNTWAADRTPAGNDEARLLEWSLVLPDAEHVEGAAMSMEAAGNTISWYGNAWTASDPWGTVLRISTSS